jgi:PAS domain S-box-containing protein
VFLEFIKAIATNEHPLVVFLDDLQWIDAASLSLLHTLLTNVGVSHILVIGAYRDNEVDAFHPLTMSIEALLKEQVRIGQMTLGNLSEETVNELIADTLCYKRSETLPITHLIYSKTEGNPFFLLQTLGGLVERQGIYFDIEKRRWQWDISALKGMEITDNVISLMLGKIQRLPQETQYVMPLAACIGFRFNLPSLGIIAGQSEEVILTNIQPALREGLLLPFDGDYQFAHDRIQQATYSLIPEKERAAVHLQIGRRLLSQTEPEEFTEKIFDIVNHLNQGVELIADPDERTQLAELNVAAGRKSRDSIAYVPARNFFATAASLLSEEKWESKYEFVFALYLDWAECEYLRGEFEEAEAIFEALLIRAKSDFDRAAVYDLRLKMYQVAGKYDDAVTMGLKALHLFGVYIPVDDEELNLETLAEAAAVRANLGDRKITELADAPEAIDPHIKAIISLLSNVAPPAYIGSRPQIYPLIAMKMVNYSIKFGPTKESCHGYSAYGLMLCSLFNDPQLGYEFSKMSIKLNQRFGDLWVRGTVLFIHTQFVNFWLKPIATNLPLVEKAFLACLDVGNLAYANYAALSITWQAIECGDSIGNALNFSQKYANFAQGSRNEAIHQTICLEQQFLKYLIGETNGIVSFSDGAIGEFSSVKKISAAAYTCGIVWYHTMKLILTYLMGEDAASRVHAEEAKKALSAVMAMPIEATFYFFHALVLSRSYRDSEATDRAELLKTLEAYQAKYAFWAKNCPENYGARYALISAEIAEINGDELSAERLFEQAIESAKVNKFIYCEGIANEAAAHFYETRGFNTIAQAYLREARYCYDRWGAIGKVKQLESQHPWLMQAREMKMRSLDTEARILDLDTVMKATHAISSEIEMDKLLSEVMHIVIENAGAQTGFLLMEKGDEWVVTARGDIDRAEVDVLTPISIEKSDVVSLGIVRFVARANENVVLDDAANQGEYINDPHIRSERTKSLLCAPLLSRGRLVGILYLENNLTTHAFTPDRIRLLEMLLSQAATSLENAGVYEALKESESKYRRIIDTANEGIWTLGPDMLTVSVNARMAEMIGYRVEEIIGRPVTDFMFEEDWSDHYEKMENRCKGMSEHFERRFRRKEGQTVWTLASASPILDAEGSYNGSFTMFTDITERKRAEDALSERVMLAELSADIGYSLTMQGDLQSILNKCAEALVQRLDVAFARIWTFNAAENVLELQASAGMYTAIDGSHSRVPLGGLKVGLIAQERKPHVTNAVIGDPRVHDQEWAEREGMVAFAGHPLTVEERLVGVMAMFSRNPLTDVTIKALASVSNEIAIGIERKQAEEALRRLTEELEERVKDRTAELETKNTELARLNKLFIGRELRMVELKERIRELETGS